MAEIRMEGVTRRHGDAFTVNDLTLAIADGEFVVLLGPSGSGKTTVLRLIAGLEPLNAGIITIDGRDANRLPPWARNLAIVFADGALYPHMSVFDNLAFPLRAPAMDEGEDAVAARVQTIASRLEIGDRLEAKPADLSPEDVRRVALARALVRRPAAFLMDEPLSGLDERTRARLRQELRVMRAESGATLLTATDDAAEAMAMADRIAIMDDGQIVQTGTPRDIYEMPRDISVAKQLGGAEMNLVPQGLLDDGGAPGGTRTVGARTENLTVEKVTSRKKSDGTIARIDRFGEHDRLRISIGEREEILVLAPADSGLSPGDRVTVALTSPIWFDAAGNRIAARS